MAKQALDNPPDKIENCPHPRDTTDLFGHELAEQAFLNAINNNKLHHAWLITGPKGCGKSTLAYRVAKTLFGVPSDPQNGVLGTMVKHPISSQISAGSYSDLLVISKQWNDKTKKWRSDITVDQIREIGQLFAHRAAADGWRICIVDCVDDLNHNAANALLKILEEPPAKGLLILVCNQPGKLLDTIKSRCRALKLRSPGIEVAAKIAVTYGADPDKAAFAAELAKGSPGRTVQIANNNGSEIWQEIENIFNSLPLLDRVDLHKLADKLAAKSAVQSLELFLELLALRMNKEIRLMATNGELNRVGPWIAVMEENQKLQTDLGRINLDPAMVIQQIILRLCQAAAKSEQLKVSS